MSIIVSWYTGKLMTPSKLTKTMEFSLYALFIIVPLILSPVSYELFEFPKILAVYALAIILAFAWIAKTIIAGKLAFRLGPIGTPLLIFAFSQILSTIFSLDPHTSLWGYYSRFHGGLASTISYLIIYFALVTHWPQTGKRIAQNLITVSLTTGVIVSLYGIAQHFGIDAHIWIQDVKNRIFSTLGQPNWLATYLIPLILISLALAIKKRQYYLLTALFSLTLFFTKSRSGFTGLAVAIAVFYGLLILQKTKQIVWKYLLAFLAVVAISGYIILQKSTPVANTDKAQPPLIELGGSSSTDIRKVVWQGAMDIWRHYPVVGSGVETFAYSYYNFRPVAHNLLSEWDFLYNKAHNEWLNLLANSGALGLASYLLIVAWYTIWTFKNRHPESFLLNAAFLAGFLGMTASNFFGFAVVPVALFWFTLPALAFLTSQQPPKKTPQSPLYYRLNNFQYVWITLLFLAVVLAIFRLISFWHADKLFNFGRNLVKADRLTDGYPQLQQAVALFPNEPLFRNDLAEAEARLAAAYSQVSDPQTATQAAVLAQQFTQSAAANTDLVIAQNSVNLNYWRSRVKIFLLLSYIDPVYEQRGLEALNEAIDLSPTDAKLYYNLGLLYNQLGQTGLAEQTLLTTIDLKPNYEAARFDLANLYEQTNRIDLARREWQYILTYLNPGNEKAQQKLEN